MEVKGVSGGVTVVGSDAPTEYHIAQRSEISGAPNTQLGLDPDPVLGSGLGLGLKKKRGRPRKYVGPDGSVIVALSPKPISVAGPGPAPGIIDFSAEKRPKFKPTAPATATATTVLKPQLTKVEAENIGEWVSSPVGANLTPYIITAYTGEDVTMKVLSFSQQGPRAICILSAVGSISSVTLRQSNSSGGTLTYEGRFEILSLSGSFMPSESGGIKNRSGGLSVSLSGPDGRVIGGGVAGLLIAASPVQIVVGSFLAANQNEQKPKKHKPEYIISGVPTSTVNFSNVGVRENDGSQRPHNSGTGYMSFRDDTKNGSADHNDSYHEG